MKFILIDGYNVIARGLAGNPKKDFETDDSRRGYREALIRLAKDYARGKQELEVRIYFDGAVDRFAAELSDRSVKVIFTKGDQGADHAIIKFCKTHPHPRDIEVATDDQATLAFYIRSYVGKVLSVAELIRRLKPVAPFASAPSRQPTEKAEKPLLSQGDRQAINRVLPPSWFR